MSFVADHTVFTRYKLHHILFWMCYGAFGYWFGQMSTPPEYRGLTMQAAIINGVYLFALIPASYISLYWLIPHYLFSKRYGSFTVLVLLDILLFAGLIALGFYFTYRDNREALASIFKIGSIVPATVFSVGSTVAGLSAAKIFRERKRSEQKAKQAEKEKLEAELKYLKAQTNPHFLFNSINNIYFTIRKDNALAESMLLKFSELLRYQLYECNTDSIALETELVYLKSYIDLEKLRKGNVTVILKDEIDAGSLKIAPLLLIPFVENAFKYVSSAKPYNFIDINMSLNGSVFMFTIGNSREKAQMRNHAGGIGIENVRRRLALLYHERHSLKITDDNDIFTVSLNIDLR